MGYHQNLGSLSWYAFEGSDTCRSNIGVLGWTRPNPYRLPMDKVVIKCDFDAMLRQPFPGTHFLTQTNSPEGETPLIS